jgi:hypothetical protein
MAKTAKDPIERNFARNPGAMEGVAYKTRKGKRIANAKQRRDIDGTAALTRARSAE